MKTSGTSLAYAALLMAMIVWGSSFIALKIAFSQYDPMFVIFGRMALGLLFFIPVLAKNAGTVRKQDIGLILLMGFFEPCLYFIFEARALTLTTASQAGMITSTLPLIVGITAYFILKEQLSRTMLLGFFLAIGGVVWLTLGGRGTEDATNPALGNLMEMLAMVCAAGYTLSLKRLSSRYSPFFLTGVQALMGALFFLPLVLVSGSGFPGHYPVKGSLAVLYLGIAVTLGGYGLYNFGTSRIPASKSSAFVNLIPVVSLILSIVILGEKVGLHQLLASALILCGVLVSQITPAKTPGLKKFRPVPES